MNQTASGILGFFGSLFSMFFNILQNIWTDASIDYEMKLILLAVYLVIFIALMTMIFSITKFVINLIAKGISSIFNYTTQSLRDPKSIPYVAAVVLLQSVPWYFMVLLIILIFCGLLAILTGGGAWEESFKYILGATVGSLIGVIKKQENSEFEHIAFQRLIERDAPDISDSEEQETISANGTKEKSTSR